MPERLKVYEVMDKSKVYDNVIGSNKKTIKQRYFRTETKFGVEREELKQFLKRSLKNSKNDKDKSISICCYFENLGWVSGAVFNVDEPEDINLYDVDYNGNDEDLGNI
jgi:hypothetical protein